jgi:hypothetical protein
MNGGLDDEIKCAQNRKLIVCRRVDGGAVGRGRRRDEERMRWTSGTEGETGARGERGEVPGMVPGWQGMMEPGGRGVVESKADLVASSCTFRAPK